MLSKSSIWVESGNFYGGFKSKGLPFLVVGFDTEYKTPANAFDRQSLELGLGRNSILSYQVHCKVYDNNLPDCSEWGGIIYPEDGSIDNRLSLTEVLTFAISQGIATGAVKAVPQMIYLVGHFTRADVPAFSDFQNLTQMMSVRRQNIRHRSRRKLAECGPRLGLGFRRRACGVASADIRWSVA